MPQISKIKNKRGANTNDHADTKRIVREYYE